MIQCNVHLSLTNKHFEPGFMEFTPPGATGTLRTKLAQGYIRLVRPYHPDGPFQKRRVQFWDCLHLIFLWFPVLLTHPHLDRFSPEVEILCVKEIILDTDIHGGNVVCAQDHLFERLHPHGRLGIGENHRMQPGTDV